MPRALPARPRVQAAIVAGTKQTMLKSFRATAAAAAVRGRPGCWNLSALERLAIRPSTEDLYLSFLRRLVGHCLALGLDWADWGGLDVLLVDFFNGLYLDGVGPDVGSGTLAALGHFLPGLGKQASSLLPRASRAVQGWRRRTPPFTRLPLPRAAMGAIVGVLVHWGLLRAAFLTALAHVCYLRPQEMMQLRGRHLVAPASSAGPAYQYRSLLLHDSLLNQTGKTGVFDDAVVVDMDPWLYPAMQCIHDRLSPDELVMDVSFSEYRKAFISAANLLGLGPLEPHPYQLRHGGASEDLTLGRRSAEQVRLRGRWATFVSVKRYAKDARLLDTMGSVDPGVFAYGNLVLDNFTSVMSSGTALLAETPARVAAALLQGQPVPPPQGVAGAPGGGR